MFSFGKKVMRWILLLLCAFFAVAPVIFLMTGSFLSDWEIWEALSPVFGGGEGFVDWKWIPGYPTMKHVVELLMDSPEFFRMFWNSVLLTAGILAGQIVFGMPAAWGLARYEFCGKKLVYAVYVVMMMMPFQVTMLSEYLVLDRLQLLDTRAAVILPGIFSTFPVFIMYRFFCGIPESILEAARIDGAKEWQLFWRIGIPLGASGIVSALVLSFLECWSMIEQPMTFLESKDLWPLSLFLPEIHSGNAGLCFCASFAALAPAVFAFLTGQDYLEQGIACESQKTSGFGRKGQNGL